MCSERNVQPTTVFDLPKIRTRPAASALQNAMYAPSLVNSQCSFGSFCQFVLAMAATCSRDIVESIFCVVRVVFSAGEFGAAILAVLALRVGYSNCCCRSSF